MHLWLRLVAALLAVATFVIPSQAHSTTRNPIDYVSIVEDAVLVSPANRVTAHSHFDLTFRLHAGQQKIKLSLEPNADLLPDSLRMRRRHPDGRVEELAPIDRRAHKVFRGTAYVQRVGRSGYREAGWARITVTRDGDEPVFVGAFQIDGDSHHVQTARAYNELRHPMDPEVAAGADVMVVWRDSDVVKPVYTGRKELRRDVVGVESCSVDALPYNAQYRALDTRDLGRMHSLASSSSSSLMSLFGRAIDGSSGSGATVNLLNNIGSTVGCPTTRKVALMGIATDCTYTASFDSEQDARSNIIAQVNTASEVYERTFNISLGIKTLEISDATCPTQASSDAPWNVDCKGSATISDRLNMFSQWRGAQDDSNAFWTLLSTCNTNTAVGLAWLGQLCVAEASETKATDGSTQNVSGANVVVKTTTEWQVIAHEIGHTFGAVHDCIADTCSSGGAEAQTCCPLSRGTCNAAGAYMMNPSTGDSIKDFSPCSIGNVCGALNLGATRSDCLSDNKGVTTISGSQCGNGIVEDGEDCDCGGEDECGDNACCDAKTCTFKGDAVCDPSNEECCTSACQMASKGTVCRASLGECDPAETCSGTTSSCPANAHSPDGDSCGSGLTCASGQCTSRDLQCRTALGADDDDGGTTACSDSSSCYMCCNSTALSPNQQRTGQVYLDGTPCEGDGKCYSGACSGGSVGNDIGQWFKDHKGILIPVGASLGAVIVLGVLFCCLRSCRRRSRAAEMAEASKWSPSQQQQEAWGPYSGPPGGAGWSMEPHHQQGGGGVPPPPPPPLPPAATRPPMQRAPMSEQGYPGQQQYMHPDDGGQEWQPPHHGVQRYA
jgi:hypothetical protein